MKETYVRFRCSEEEKAIIEAMALQDKDAGNMSEYILNLVRNDVEKCELIEIFAVQMDSSLGQEKDRESCGSYLFKEGRASKDVYRKIEEKRNTIWGKDVTSPIVYMTADSRMLTTDIISKECWLVK